MHCCRQAGREVQRASSFQGQMESCCQLLQVPSQHSVQHINIWRLQIRGECFAIRFLLKEPSPVGACSILCLRKEGGRERVKARGTCSSLAPDLIVCIPSTHSKPGWQLKGFFHLPKVACVPPSLPAPKMTLKRARRGVKNLYTRSIITMCLYLISSNVIAMGHERSSRKGSSSYPEA